MRVKLQPDGFVSAYHATEQAASQLMQTLSASMEVNRGHHVRSMRGEAAPIVTRRDLQQHHRTDMVCIWEALTLSPVLFDYRGYEERKHMLRSYFRTGLPYIDCIVLAALGLASGRIDRGTVLSARPWLSLVFSHPIGLETIGLCRVSKE